MVFNYDVLVILDALYNLAELHGTADSRHVLDTDFVRAGVDELLGEVYVVFNGVDDKKFFPAKEKGFLAEALSRVKTY